MNEMPKIDDLYQFASATPFDKEFMTKAKELLAFIDTLPDYVPTKRDIVRARIRAMIKKIRRKVFYAISEALENMARKARYEA